MDYSYNYKYLYTFMTENRLSKRDLLEALGCQDYATLNKWLCGKVPIHVTALLRFCNFYNIELANFFFDGDGHPTIEPKQPLADSQILPAGMDGSEGERSRGMRIIETRVQERTATSPEQKKAVEEGFKRLRDKRQRDINATGVPQSSANEEKMQDIRPAEAEERAGRDITLLKMRLKLEYSEALFKAEKEHSEQIERIRECNEKREAQLLDIITRQREENAILLANKLNS